MSEQMKLSRYTIQLLLTRYPLFGSDLASITIEFNEHLKYHTAATDGKKIYLDPNYFASLNGEGRLFVLAHEIMHIKFLHHLRLERNGIKRDLEIWNEVTDAIINANLERDGFKIPKGCVNIPRALQYSAEELYNILKEQKEENKSKAETRENSSNNGENENTSSNEQDIFRDDHSMWEKAFEEYKNSTTHDKEENKSKTENNEDHSSQSKKEQEINENQEFIENRQERIKKAKESYERMRQGALKKVTENNHASAISLGNVGNENNSIDWKLLLRREIEKEETIWTQRRGILENNYAYRLEENEMEEEAESEVLIDVSGSVNLNLVKSFLRIVKPMLKSSKLKVGCFNTKFWGWVDIKSTKDIDNFTISEGARGSSANGTDLDLPVRSFSKKREVNKLIFTDGYPSFGCMPKDDLKGENVIWIVYGNKDFHPCCGKVIQITEEQLKRLNALEETDSYGKSI